MSDGTSSEARDKLHETIGAVNILFVLREEMEQWLEEAQDDSKREALENVVGHLQAMEEEYRQRRTDLQGKVSS